MDACSTTLKYKIYGDLKTKSSIFKRLMLYGKSFETGFLSLYILAPTSSFSHK